MSQNLTSDKERKIMESTVPKEVDLGDIFSSIWKYKIFVVIFTIIGYSAGMLVQSAQPILYSVKVPLVELPDVYFNDLTSQEWASKTTYKDLLPGSLSGGMERENDLRGYGRLKQETTNVVDQITALTNYRLIKRQNLIEIFLDEKSTNTNDQNNIQRKVIEDLSISSKNQSLILNVNTQHPSNALKTIEDFVALVNIQVKDEFQNLLRSEYNQYVAMHNFSFEELKSLKEKYQNEIKSTPDRSDYSLNGTLEAESFQRQLNLITIKLEALQKNWLKPSELFQFRESIDFVSINKFDVEVERITPHPRLVGALSGIVAILLASMVAALKDWYTGRIT